MKFHTFKNSKYYPGFVYPPDEDGKQRAQKVIPSGYVSDTKSLFFDFQENLPGDAKEAAEIYALNKFNRKFQLSLA